jgi:hypothetical protein
MQPNDGCGSLPTRASENQRSGNGTTETGTPSDERERLEPSEKNPEK